MNDKDSKDRETYASWRGPVEDAEFRERLRTTRDNLSTTVAQLNAYVAELDMVLRAVLESDQRDEAAVTKAGEAERAAKDVMKKMTPP